MKKIALIVYSLIASSAIGQNIWEPINFPDTLRSKAINAEKEDLIFVATGGNNDFNGLFRTTDGGNNWELLQLDTLGGFINIFTIEYNSEGDLFVGTGQGIFRSHNNGDDFEKIFPAVPNVLNLAFSPNNEIYAACWGFIFRSADNGENWDTLFVGGNIYFGDIDFGLNGEIYTVGGSYDGPNTGSGFHRSLDNGDTWENIGITDKHLHNIEVNANGDIIVGGESAAIYVSTDLGSNWTLQTNIHTTALESDTEDRLFAGVQGYSNNGMRFSENWGGSWTNLNDSILYPYIHQISISYNNIVYLQCKGMSAQNAQLFRSINPILNNMHYGMPSSNIEAFPNPVSNMLFIKLRPPFNCEKYVIYNLDLQIIKSDYLNNGQVDMSDINSGLYIIELESGERIDRLKIIKQ